MKAEQTVARLSAIFLLVFLFTGTKSFSQSVRDQEQTVRESRTKDSIAFDDYFARRGEISAIKDSIDAQSGPFGAQPSRSASANNPRNDNDGVAKSNTTELNSVQMPRTAGSLTSSRFNFNATNSEQRRISNKR